MFKNIEKFLLIHFPIVWNLKLVPTLIIVLLVNFALFCLSFTTTTFITKSFSFFSGISIATILLTVCAILLQIIILTFWLIQYNKHNAFKQFYPQSTKSRYLEWILSFILLIFIVSIPQSIIIGKNAKKRVLCPKQDFEKEMKIMKRISSIYPSSIYLFEFNDLESPLLVGDAKVDRTRFNTKLYTYEQDAESPDNPIEYIGPSFLYYNSYISSEKYAKEKLTMKQWLRTEQKDSIRATIQAYLDLHKKYNLSTNIDVDTWMNIIYNPPFYPVDPMMIIETRNYNDKSLYTEYNILEPQYYDLDSIYNSTESAWSLIYTWIIALVISLFVFSARVTSARVWLFSFLLLGIFILFTSFFLYLLYNNQNSFFLSSSILWASILIIIGIYLVAKVIRQKEKGKSSIFASLFIWISTTLPLLLYMLLVSIFIDPYSENEDFFNFLIHPVTFIAYALIIMYPICILVKKWKALPEN